MANRDTGSDIPSKKFFRQARFLTSAAKLKQAPPDDGIEVAFVGRSNAGKSTAINLICDQKSLARTSRTPGRTQLLNFFTLSGHQRLVDLPGYGYAKVPLAVRESWKPMVEGVLRRRRDRIALGILVVDARHEPSPLDLTMRDWLVGVEVDYLVLGTKADKLSGNGRARALGTLRKTIGASELSEPILVSAKTGLGMQAVWSHLDDALDAAGARGER